MLQFKPFKISYLRLSVILLLYICILSIVAIIIFSKYLKVKSNETDYSKILYSTYLSDLKGSKYNLANLKNKILVINFWAPWCHNCVEELSELNNLAIRLAPTDVNIIGISIDSIIKTNQFLATKKLVYTQLVSEDTGLALSQALGNSIGGIPFTVGIDSTGEIFFHHVGKIQVDSLIRTINEIK